MRPMKSVLLVLVFCAAAAPALAAPVTWVDWTSGTTGASGSATGVLNLGGATVNVTYSGEIRFIQTNGGTNWWVQPNPARLPYTATAGSPTGVDNAPGTTDIIALSQVGAKTLTFSQPVNNLFFALVSLNGNGYQFNNDFDVVSWGQGYWGCGAIVKVTVPGGYQANAGGVCGSEPHGVIRFMGAVSSITWTSQVNEDWNGFTVGTYGLAVPPPAAPEPAMLLLFGTGVIAVARRFAKRS